MLVEGTAKLSGAAPTGVPRASLSCAASCTVSPARSETTAGRTSSSAAADVGTSSCLVMQAVDGTTARSARRVWRRETDMTTNLGLPISIDNRLFPHWVVRVRKFTRRVAALCCAVGAMALWPRASLAQSPTEASLAEAQAAVVRFRGRDLFEVRAPVGALQPPERARAIEGRLGAIAAGSADALDAIHVVERERTSDLLAGEQLVLSVTDADATPLGRTRQQLAADYAVVLRRALQQEFSGRSLRGITTALALTALATLVFVIVLRVLTGLFRRAARACASWEGTRISGRSDSRGSNSSRRTA